MFGLNKTALFCIPLVSLAIGTLASSPAQALSFTVPGTANPWLAGMPNGSGASFTDSAPGQSPIPVIGLPLTPGGELEFTVSGSVSNTPSPSNLSPDGNTSFVTSHTPGAQNGISNITAPFNSLLGVFLGSGQPNLTSAPTSLNFSTGLSRDYSSLNPLLKQVFFIGNGLTSSAQRQRIVIPTGATRLFLGTMDSFGWFNNSGSFNVQVNAIPETTAIPTPALLPGLIGMGVAAIRKRKTEENEAAEV